VFDQFLREKRLCQNVSPATLSWYEQSLKTLGTENPTDDDLKQFVITLRQRGLKATGVNCKIRAVNSYLKWSGSPLRIARLKEPSRIPPTFTERQVKLLVGYKPRNFDQRRLHLLILTLLDCGLRISEAISLRVTDVDLDNCLMTVIGKGDRERIIPFSLELRRRLYLHTRDMKSPHTPLFHTRDCRKLDRHIVSRDTRLLCKRLGFVPPPQCLHSLRRTMASAYIRSNGSVVMLSRILGHSQLSTTMLYVHCQVQDLQQAHEQHSLLKMY
jgi:integrase/recombinase XerD